MFLACNIFTKDRKKVTFNPEVYECLPDHFKLLVNEQEIKSGISINLTAIKMFTS